MNERLEAAVTGRVQLVMYRDFATRKARGLKLTGEVQNMPDGTVRVVAEGPRKQLELYIAKLRKGSLLSRVESVTATWLPVTDEFTSFTICYD